MAVKERTLTKEIAWRLAEVYAAQTHGNYDEETLFDRGGDWAAEEVGKVLSERLGVPIEALEAGVVREMIEALERQNSEIVLLIIDAITWFYDEETGSFAVNESDRKQGLERLRQVLLMLDPAAAARFPQFYQ